MVSVVFPDVLPCGEDCVVRYWGQRPDDAVVRLEGRVYSLRGAMGYLCDCVGLTLSEALAYLRSLPHLVV